MHRQSKRCIACHVASLRRPENQIGRVCPVCGSSFIVHRAHINRGQGKYCSRSCARSGSPTRQKRCPVVSCAECGAKFEKHAAEIRKNVGALHFCSPACWYTRNTRENHYEWAGGQNERMNPDSREWRKAVLARDGNRCRLCASTERVETHHIHRFATHPDLRWVVVNGITVCRECHKALRGKEEAHADVLELQAVTPHHYCRTVDDVWRAFAAGGDQ